MIKSMIFAGLVGLQATTPESANVPSGDVTELLTSETTTAQARACDHSSERWMPGALQISPKESTTDQKEAEYWRRVTPKNVDCALV